MIVRLKSVAAAAALLAALGAISVSAQVTFKAFVDFCAITSMSGDQSVAVGTYDDGYTHDVFRWTAAGGVELIGVPNQAKYGDLSISRDGKTIVGTVPDSQGAYHAAVWQGGKNWKILGEFPGAVAGESGAVSIGLGVSGDGSVIVGQAYISATQAVAFRWDQADGMVNLGTFDGGINSDSSPLAVSADGGMVIGWDYKQGFLPPGPGGAAENGRRGAIWWGGKERLLHPLGWAGEAWATNNNGSIIVGQFHPLDAAETNGITGGASTYLWTAWDGHFEDLGAVKVPIGGGALGNYVSQPYAVSDDGSVVGGDTGVSEKFAMIWTPKTGMMYLSDFLTMSGVTDHLSWVVLTRTVYISPDGRVVVGYGAVPGSPFPIPKTWIVTLR
jgi:probable HAF family extracellular repeat protein